MNFIWMVVAAFIGCILAMLLNDLIKMIMLKVSGIDQVQDELELLIKEREEEDDDGKDDDVQK